MEKINMVGKVFGKLKVLHEDLSNTHKHLKWVCSCECGNVKSIAGTHLRRDLIISCGCSKKLNQKGGISGDLWYNITKSKVSKRSKRRELEFNITKEYVHNLFIKQNGKCALSGIKITLPTKWKDRSYTASLDRVNNNEGYIQGNVQWVHKHVNIMKNSFPEKTFIYLCNKVSENNVIQNVTIEEINNFKWGLNTK